MHKRRTKFDSEIDEHKLKKTIMGVQNSTNSKIDLARFYGDCFYEGHLDHSYASALKYADIVSPLLNPKRVVDVGCGRGAWLKAFKEKGASKLVGYDGTWNSQENMIDQSIVFHAADLNKPINILDAEHYDLTISVEVAEHLEPTSAQDFIKSLTKLSDVVLFGAAYTKQGGANHINEQPHTYWASCFSAYDYVPYDLFRPKLWGDKEIPFWYQQNTFLYVRQNTPISELLVRAEYEPMKNVTFMNCIHPALYERCTREIGTKDLVRKLIIKMIPKFARPRATKMKV